MGALSQYKYGTTLEQAPLAVTGKSRIYAPIPPIKRHFNVFDVSMDMSTEASQEFISMNIRMQACMGFELAQCGLSWGTTAHVTLSNASFSSLLSSSLCSALIMVVLAVNSRGTWRKAQICYVQLLFI